MVKPDKLGHLGPVADACAVVREAKQARRTWRSTARFETSWRAESGLTPAGSPPRGSTIRLKLMERRSARPERRGPPPGGCRRPTASNGCCRSSRPRRPPTAVPARPILEAVRAFRGRRQADGTATRCRLGRPRGVARGRRPGRHRRRPRGVRRRGYAVHPRVGDAPPGATRPGARALHGAGPRARGRRRPGRRGRGGPMGGRARVAGRSRAGAADAGVRIRSAAGRARSYAGSMPGSAPESQARTP